MASTRSTYCPAISWKMSDAVHDDCIFTTIGVCAVTTDGMASVPAVAPAATAPDVRNFRRDTLFFFTSVMPVPPVQSAIANRMFFPLARPSACESGILTTSETKLAD